MHIKPIALYLFVAFLAPTVQAQTARLANGTILQGEVVNRSSSGLDIRTPTGIKTYTWDTLSWATRFRYEPAFRANYDAVLNGQPPATRTRKPDPEEIAVLLPKPKEDENKLEEPVEETSSTPAIDSPLIWDHLAVYETPDSFRTGGFPTVPIRTPQSTYYHGLQFGPGRKHVVYFAIDPKTSSDLRDVLHLYSPYDPAYTTPATINGFKKGGGTVTFKKFPLTSKFGEIDALFEIEYLGLPNDEEMLMATVELVYGDQKCRFILGGRLLDHATDGQIIPLNGLIDNPLIQMTSTPKTSPVIISGALLMSHLRVVPKDNMENKLAIEIVKEDGSIAQKETLRLDEAGLQTSEQFSLELKKPEPGQTYTVRASIDLGPFIGPVSAEETVLIPSK